MYVVACPQCMQKVSLAEQSLGTTIICPNCSGSFHVSAHSNGDGSGSLPEPPPVAAGPPIADIRRRLMVPAIGLIVTGAGTTLLGLLFIPALLFPEVIRQQEPPEPLELAMSIVLMIVTLTLGIVTLFGSIKMLRLENYRMSIAASIAAMIPCYCCFVGLPTGIWALVVLRDPNVKRAFD